MGPFLSKDGQDGWAVEHNSSSLTLFHDLQSVCVDGLNGNLVQGVSRHRVACLRTPAASVQ